MEKILLITGASSDVGIKLLKQIAKDYSKIICHYGNDDSKLKELNENIGNKLILVKGDFSNIEHIDDFVKKADKQNIVYGTGSDKKQLEYEILHALKNSYFLHSSPFPSKKFLSL